MNYPKYTREQNKNCKLTEEDIRQIRTLAGQGMKKNAIAKELNMPYNVIWYWLLPDEKRKAKIRQYYLSTGKQRDIDNREAKHERQNRSRARKYKTPEYKRYLEVKRKQRSFKKTKLE